MVPMFMVPMFIPHLFDFALTYIITIISNNKTKLMTIQM